MPLSGVSDDGCVHPPDSLSPLLKRLIFPGPTPESKKSPRRIIVERRIISETDHCGETEPTSARGSSGRAETDLVEQLAAASKRVFGAKLTPPAAAALCEAIARRRLDAESQAAGPHALHVCGPPRRAGSLRRAR